MDPSGCVAPGILIPSYYLAKKETPHAHSAGGTHSEGESLEETSS
jgi:hypothetical protein